MYVSISANEIRNRKENKQREIEIEWEMMRIPPRPTGAAEILEGGGIEIPLPAALADPGVAPEAPRVLPS